MSEKVSKAVYQGKIPYGVSTERELAVFEAEWERGVYVPDGMSKKKIIEVSRIIRDATGSDRFAANSAAREIISYFSNG